MHRSPRSKSLFIPLLFAIVPPLTHSLALLFFCPQHTAKTSRGNLIVLKIIKLRVAPVGEREKGIKILRFRLDFKFRLIAACFDFPADVFDSPARRASIKQG